MKSNAKRAADAVIARAVALNAELAARVEVLELRAAELAARLADLERARAA